MCVVVMCTCSYAAFTCFEPIWDVLGPFNCIGSGNVTTFRVSPAAYVGIGLATASTSCTLPPYRLKVALPQCVCMGRMVVLSSAD